MSLFSSNDADVYKALRIIKNGDLYGKIGPWLRDNLKSLQRELFAETEPMKMNRLVGQIEILSEVIAEIENSPANEAAYANGGGLSEIGSIPN